MTHHVKDDTFLLSMIVFCKGDAFLSLYMMPLMSHILLTQSIAWPPL